MMNEVQGLLSRVTTGEIDQTSVQQAAQDHFSSIDPRDLRNNVQTAADNAQNNGEGGIASELSGLLSQHGSNPEGLKGAVVSLITTNPQILQHFEPGFAKAILSKV